MTRSFYLAESAEQAEALKNNPKEFFRRGKERIGEEITRSKAILPVTAWNLIRDITEKAFWGGRMEWLSEKSIIYVYPDSLIAQLHCSFSRFYDRQRLCSTGIHVHAFR